MDYLEPTKRGKSPRVNESAEATDHEQHKVSQNLSKQPETYVMPDKSSESHITELSCELSNATLKRKSIADSETTYRGKSPVVEESVKTPKDKCIIQYKRTYKK